MNLAISINQCTVTKPSEVIRIWYGTDEEGREKFIPFPSPIDFSNRWQMSVIPEITFHGSVKRYPELNYIYKYIDTICPTYIYG